MLMRKEPYVSILQLRPLAARSLYFFLSYSACKIIIEVAF